MEKVDLDYLRKQWKDELGYYWGRAQKEIDEYFEMIKDTNCRKAAHLKSISRDNFLKDSSLNEERLKDSLFIPEILDLLTRIKKINYDEFPDNWVSGEYDNKEHASYIWNSLIPEFRQIAIKVIEFKVAQYNSFYDKPMFPTSKKLFINKNFMDYGLKQYGAHLEIINQIHSHDLYYTLLPFLLRSLFENLIHDILSQSLHTKHKELYYYQGKIKQFSILIYILKECRKPVFGHLVKGILNDDLIKNLHEIRKKGNLSVHEVVETITKEDISKWKPIINLIVKQLLTVYEKVEGKNLEIDSETELKIKRGIGMIPTKKKEKKIHKSISQKPSETAENPIQELFALFSRPGIEPHLAKKISSQIKKIGEERFLEVLKFYLRESKFSHYIGIQRLFRNTANPAESELFMIFEDEFFLVEVRYKRNANRVHIRHKKSKFDYSKPEKNSEVRVAFLKSFRERCDESGIILTEEQK